MHKIHTLRAHQRCGTLTIERDAISRVVTIKSMFSVAAYINVHAGVIDVYGLGNCGTFEIEHRRYQRYIENSTIRTQNGVIFENKMRRSRFTKPATVLRFSRIYDFQLRCVELSGACYLRDVAPSCVDTSASHFTLKMRGDSRLLSGLPVEKLHCTLADTAYVSTASELSAVARLTWQLSELDLIIEGNVHVSGIHVTHRLTTIILPGYTATLDIGTDASCHVTNPPIIDRHAQIMLMGIERSPPRHYVQNENGMFLYVPVTETLPQELLDASRADYEQRSEAKSSEPLFTVSGNDKLKDEPASDAQTACTVCMTNKAVAVFAGCGHCSTCVECTREMASYLGTCPICRTEIRTAVIPFIS